MRLWSIHPKYIDNKRLVALWREALLAQKVLGGNTKGYKKHPQLIRFSEHDEPLTAISAYLTEVWKESLRRGYKFDRTKILNFNSCEKIMVTKGQLKYEFELLCYKLREKNHILIEEVECIPFFEIIEGDIALWERQKKM